MLHNYSLEIQKLDGTEFIIYKNSFKLINTIAIKIKIQLSDNMDKVWK